MPRVVHFEIYADNVDRAIKFYSDTFGWTVNQAPGMEYWLVMTGEEGPGIDGGIMARPDPAAVTTSIVDVPSVDDYTPKITAAGGALLTPKMAIPTVGYVAYFKDTEGNPFGIFQHDETAA